jgi:hypothetical protein
LVYLERGEERHGVLVLTLWASGGIADTEADAQGSRRQMAESADTGVCSRNYRVLRRLGRRPERAMMNAAAGAPGATTR